MSRSIDEALHTAFTPENFKDAFQRYKESKRDFLSPETDPTFRVPMGADGVSLKTFEKQIDLHADKICKRIHAGTYQFYPFREVEIEKEPAQSGKPAKYRTLSIATIRDAVVQNILYRDVLHGPIEKRFAQLDSPHIVSFAYRRGKSAPQAARTVFRLLQDGYYHVFDADITSYFDTIPHDRLLNRLAEAIGGTSFQTYHLVRRFMKTDRVLHESYRDQGPSIFQKRKPKRVKRVKGVPQGGVLSGILANLYFHDFDQWIVYEVIPETSIRYIRYADDFIFLSRNYKEIDDILPSVRSKIKENDLTLNEDKIYSIDIQREDLNFVGFQFTLNDMRVRDKNIERYKNRVREVLRSRPKTRRPSSSTARHLRWLSRRISYKVQGLSGIERCSKCHHCRISAPRSWIAFFSSITDESQLRDLDRWTRAAVTDLMHKRDRLRLKRKQFKRIDFKNLVDEYYRVRRLKLKPCKCDLEKDGLWQYASDLYKDKYFYTPARRKPFRVSTVTSTGLEVSINCTKHVIRREIIESILNEVRTTGEVRRTELEYQGIEFSSQIIVLLSVLPDLASRVNPVRLIDEGKIEN